jgi:hypothetical protein
MGTSRRSSVCVVSGPALLLLVGAAQLACYKPAIVDGGFKCSRDAGTKACPEGFTCGSDGFCWRHADGGMDMTMTTDASDGGDAPETEVGPICYPPRANCTATPDAGLCDPYCETGCSCVEKCSVNTAGALTCKPLTAGQQVRNLQEPCMVQSSGTANQNDQCAPGLVCVEDSCGGGSGSGRCYAFCRNDGECTNAPCNKDVGGGFKVCDVPYRDCVPLATPNNTGCGGSQLMCYLSTTDASKTICDCEFPPGLREGDICTKSRQCNPGLVCVPNGVGNTVCTRVCRLGMAGDCTFGTCKTYMVNGVANATYGFCGL